MKFHLTLLTLYYKIIVFCFLRSLSSKKLWGIPKELRFFPLPKQKRRKSNGCSSARGDIVLNFD
jgi:hypothetical protein